VLTADCLPVLFCDEAGGVVAAAHAGWRGLAAGILEATVAAMAVPGDRLLAWLGPAIGPSAFEVGADVVSAFTMSDGGAKSAFLAQPDGKWLCDLYALARRRLRGMGIERVHGGGYCTFNDAERFYSYRREGVTGRMASLVWIV
jgi:YfiH family protein